MKKLNLSDFCFQFTGYGHYIVVYTYPTSQKTISAKISDMQIIDLTKNEINPMQKNLKLLKQIIKTKSLNK